MWKCFLTAFLTARPKQRIINRYFFDGAIDAVQ